MEGTLRRWECNDFSYWFPKVKDCGIKVPKSVFIKLPHPNNISDEAEKQEASKLWKAFYMSEPRKDRKIVEDWVDENVIPLLKKNNLMGHIFVKNGTFSNKFNANDSCNLYGTGKLVDALININYNALLVEAGGTGEVVVREFIPYNKREIPSIYNGLPFRSEFRVFYDFDTHRVIFSVNYWDYEYCYPNLYDKTDKIIFDHERKRIEETYLKFKEKAEDEIARHFKDITSLSGAWSADLLLDDKEQLWLIDMAVAEQSAYWEKRPEQTNQKDLE